MPRPNNGQVDYVKLLVLTIAVGFCLTAWGWVIFLIVYAIRSGK